MASFCELHNFLAVSNKLKSLTVAEPNPATANAKRIATLSWCFSLRGSQIPQTNQMSVAVATNSTQNACCVVIKSDGFVQQNDGPDALSASSGDTLIKSPYPIKAPTHCAIT